MSDRQNNFFRVCSECRIECCRDARPPITPRREEIIKQYLKAQGIEVKDAFIREEYTFPRESPEGYCIFYDKESRKCLIHNVKPETCVAGPVTFDINLDKGIIEWYLKMEKICPLAGIMYREKDIFKRHFEAAKREILQLLEGLTLKELVVILKRDEPETFKIGEDSLPQHLLHKYMAEDGLNL